MLSWNETEGWLWERAFVFQEVLLTSNLRHQPAYTEDHRIEGGQKRLSRLLCLSLLEEAINVIHYRNAELQHYYNQNKMIQNQLESPKMFNCFDHRRKIFAYIARIRGITQKTWLPILQCSQRSLAVQNSWTQSNWSSLDMWVAQIFNLNTQHIWKCFWVSRMSNYSCVLSWQQHRPGHLRSNWMLKPCQKDWKPFWLLRGRTECWHQLKKWNDSCTVESSL